MKNTPGPWWVSEYRGLAICAEDAVVATITPDENGPFPLDKIDRANANLIAAAPVMFGKLTDTVTWLDREIKNLQEPSERLDDEVNQFMNLETGFQLVRLAELRDDLAETLRRIEGGEA